MGVLSTGVKKKFHSIEKRESRVFYIMISPWIFGFFGFTLIPMAASAVLGFMDWDYIADPVFKGFGNYFTLFTDEYFYISLRVTVIYSIFSVPLSLMIAFILALLLNAKIHGLSVFRTLFYLPSLVSGAASSILWMWMFNPEFGVINTILGYISIRGPEWIFSKYWALPSMIIMSLWGVGASMLIYLSGLQGIPTELYEAARIDGASRRTILFRITLPMMSSVIFYNLIIGIIGTFQTFTQAYVMTSGGPSYATYFYVYYLYNNAFKNFRIGYASAQAWVLFFIIMLLTLVVFRSSSMWVYYETEAKKTGGKRNVK
jgi:multiple sugar transport system permease protein